VKLRGSIVQFCLLFNSCTINKKLFCGSLMDQIYVPYYIFCSVLLLVSKSIRIQQKLFSTFLYFLADQIHSYYFRLQSRSLSFLFYLHMKVIWNEIISYIWKTFSLFYMKAVWKLYNLFEFVFISLHFLLYFYWFYLLITQGEGRRDLS
jgi:hypothetical protein